MKRWVATLSGWTPSIMCMMVISGLSHIPGDNLNIPPFPWFDKLLHFTVYFVLGVLLQSRGVIISQLMKELGNKHSLWLGIFIGVLHSVLDEIHQLFVPMRDFSYLDMLANGLGILTGIFLFECFVGRRNYRVNIKPLE